MINLTLFFVSKKKWEVENSKLPRNQKRPLPIKPEMLPNIGPGSGEIDRARRNQVILFI